MNRREALKVGGALLGGAVIGAEQAASSFIPVRSGKWNDPSVWNHGRVPTNDDEVMLCDTGGCVVVDATDAPIAERLTYRALHGKIGIRFASGEYEFYSLDVSAKMHGNSGIIT